MFQPPQTMVEQCSKILRSLDHRCTYARFDGFVRESELVLTELELFDPNLFVPNAPQSSIDLAAHAFRDALVKR